MDANVTEPEDGDTTYTMSPTLESEGHLLVRIYLTTTQYSMTLVGALANLATILVLRNAKEVFCPGLLVLLKGQAVVDLAVCLASTIFVLQPPMWKTGETTFDAVVCHVWHSQILYWCFVFVSIWNLVLIGFERFLAVCHPLKHCRVTSSTLKKLIAAICLMSVVCNAGGFVQVRMSNGTCVSEYAIEGEAGKKFFMFFAVWIFIIDYSLPTLLFIVLYGCIISVLCQRHRDPDLGVTNVVNLAMRRITCTAIAVTIIFILSLSWDFWFYLLGRAGVVSYIKNSLLQVIGVWLSSFNSVANPFVYLAFLPAFRKAVRATLKTKREVPSDNTPTSLETIRNAGNSISSHSLSTM